MRIEEDGTVMPEVADISIPVPWENPAPPEELSEVEGRQQYSFREASGVEIERPEWEYTGWTVEFKALVTCPWADFWVTASKYEYPQSPMGETIPKMNEPLRIPALNLSIAEALRVAKELQMGKIEADRHRAKGSDVVAKIGMVRLRHQGTGNIICADII
jgi:hypothetical protein